jgi:hypothetical protein
MPNQSFQTSLRFALRGMCCALLISTVVHGQMMTPVEQTTPITESPAPPKLKTIYWQQPLLFIPYQVNSQDPLAKEIAEVQLLFSRTGNNDWSVLQTAKPNVQGFSYHAPDDGQYWFALKHVDKDGRQLGGATIVPQLNLVIDTKQPQLSLSASATSGSSNEIMIRYEATDANLQSQSLIVEVRAAGGPWANVSVGPPEISQPNRVSGSIRYTLPAGASNIEIRGSIADATGQRGQAVATVPMAGPSLAQPNVTQNPPIAAANMANDPFRSAAKPVQEWPASNQVPSLTPQPQAHSQLAQQNMTPVAPSPQRGLAYSNVSDTPDQRRTPAKFAVDGAGAKAGTDSAHNSPVALPPTGEAEWTSTGRNPDEPLLVNARTFDVDYQLQTVGSWGVAKVELWGSQDGGATWQSFGVDPDNRSPARITVPGSGIYGFRIVVEGANSAPAAPPQSGLKAELIVTVDLDGPAAQLLGAQAGTGQQADQMLIRWMAQDDNLEPQPVGLFYSSRPNGPWSTIAAGLENTGEFAWKIERHIPNRVFLKLEVRDTAGNVTVQQTPQPIELNRPQPTGTLRNIRPVANVPNTGGLE